MCVFVPLNAGWVYTVTVRRTMLNVLVLLTLALAGESPTGILYEGILGYTHPVTRGIEVVSHTHTHLENWSLELRSKSFSAGLTASQPAVTCIFNISYMRRDKRSTIFIRGA